MPPPNRSVCSRARTGQRYALFPLTGYPVSRLPSWPEAEVRVLAAPALGARFVEYLIDLPEGKRGEFTADDRIETFYYVLNGAAELASDAIHLRAGQFGLLPPGQSLGIRAAAPTRLVVIRKVFERVDSIRPFEPLCGNAADVPAAVWNGNPGSRLQSLIPDELQYDLAVNIFNFDPDNGLPYVETHVMEHGLLMLEGRGMYYLDGDWMEVEQNDFIWMGPYCPQTYYAIGPSPTRYLYYKNVNREIAL